MKFIVDESADARVAPYLTSHGHDAVYVAEAFGPGLPDEQILAVAQRQQRIIITDDRDFAELVYLHDQPHSGVIYFRLRDTSWSTRVDRLSYVLEHYVEQLDQFLVVTDSRVRIGPPPRS